MAASSALPRWMQAADRSHTWSHNTTYFICHISFFTKRPRIQRLFLAAMSRYSCYPSPLPFYVSGEINSLYQEASTPSVIICSPALVLSHQAAQAICINMLIRSRVHSNSNPRLYWRGTKSWTILRHKP